MMTHGRNLPNAGCYIHGYCLALASEEWNGEWRRVVWGSPPYLLGRIPAALALAHRLRPVFGSFRLAFGSGATFRDGLSEARYTVKFAKEQLHSLRKFEYFTNICDEDFEYLGHLLDKALLDSDSCNTAQEVEAAARLFGDIDFTYLCSSPGHLPRVAKLAFVAAAHSAFGQSVVSLHGSQTSFHDDDGSSTLVVERPHQPWLLWRIPLFEILQRLIASMDSLLLDLTRTITGDLTLGPTATDPGAGTKSSQAAPHPRGRSSPLGRKINSQGRLKKETSPERDQNGFGPGRDQ
jgi:hypothetical protein